jgi:hypothetical protein
MSRYPAIMEIEQCEPENTFGDITRLIAFVKTYDNSFAEYVRVTRMYLFGTPIRRKGAGFRRATPGCVQFLYVHGDRACGVYAHRAIHAHARTGASG